VSEHDDPTEERELYEEVPPRSIFAATWFRVLLVVIVIGVIGAVAIPYVLDFMNPPPTRPTTAAKPPAPAVAIPATPSTGSPADKPSEKAETLPAPAASATVAPSDTKPAPPTARPTETKPAAPKSEPKTAAAPSEKKTAMAVTEATPPKTATPAAKPTPAPKADTAAKDPAPKAETKPDTMAKADTAKPVTATTPAATPKRAAVAATTTTTTTKPPTASGPFWVQVGAFKDADTAKKVAARLRDDKFSVEESVTRTGGTPKPAPTPAPAAPAAPAAKPDPASDQYDVFVSGQTPEELNKRLAAKGLAAESSSGGLVVKPSLPLRDAVALSKDLAVEGFKVQVRRAGGSMASAAAAAPAPASSAPATTDGGTELHRVRVGAFPDRAAALEAVKQLEAKGYKPYIARGAP
jgi:DedD protein